MMSRTRALFALVFAFALVAAACGDSGETTTTAAAAAPTTTATAAPTTTTAAPVTTTAPPETTTTAAPAAPGLVIWADDTREPVLTSVAADFEAATGVTVEVQLVGFGDIRGNSVQQNPTGEGPDIFIGAHDWVGELVANGVVEAIDLGGRESEFFDAAINAWSLDGQLWGVPYAIEAIALYYNKDLVPEAPTTFEDLIAACEGLGDAVEQCIGFPAPGDAYHHYPFLSSTGGYIFGFEDGVYDAADIGLDSDGAVEGFTFLDQLVKDGLANPDVDYGTMASLFTEGKSAFMWTGPWELGNVKDSGINYGVAKLPAINGNTARPFIGVQGFMINSFSENKALAQTFVLDYVATPDVMVGLFELGQRAPAHVAAFESVASDPDVQAFGASGADGQPMPSIPEMASVWENLANAITEIYNQTSDPLTALQTAAEAVRAAIG